MRPHGVLLPVVAVVLGLWGAGDALLVGWASPTLVSVAVALLVGLPVAWMGRRPYVAATIVTTALVVHGLVWSQPEAPPETISLFVVAFGVGAYGATSYVLWIVLGAGALVVQLRDVEDPGLGGLSFMLGSWVIALAVGHAVSRRESAEHGDRLVAQTTRRASAAVAAAALAAERERIARDLHEVVTHSVTRMVAQAAVGQDAVLSAPRTAEAALVAVEEVGQQALTDLRRMLGLIRGGGDTPGPQPGLAAVPSLAHASGATLLTEGDLASVPDGPSVAAYRIVQGALVDALQHSPAATPRVALVRTAAHLEIEVTSAAPDPAGRTAGDGLAGMRRRAEMYGGTLDVGPTRDGWSVRAVLTF
jgi:signal transduction histidine kinase